MHAISRHFCFKLNKVFNVQKLQFILFYLLLLPISSAFSQVKLVSWNVQNLGKSKSSAEIKFIAETLKSYDVVALQEIVAGYGGSQAVAKIADELNRSGSKWDYVISDPTSGSAYKSERYAFLWKTSIVKKIGKAWLEQKFNIEIDREPFFATFDYKGKAFTLVNFHAKTKKMQPETEIKYFKFLPDLYPNLNLIFLGDFNCPQSHTVFNPLKKMGYLPMLNGQKTTLKQKKKNSESLASEFDNIFYSPKVTKIKGDVILFYKCFTNLAEARKISDHIPIWMEFSVK